MTNLHRLLGTITAIICVTYVIFATSSCDPKPKPSPGPDTTSVPPTPQPQPFVSILELDDNGELKSIPFPCVDWLGGKKAVEAFEESKGATFVKEQAMGPNKAFLYKTNDPKNLQPQRIYIINPDKGILETSSIMIASNLVASGDQLNDNMQILLYDEGYKKIDGAKDIAYSNGTYILAFAKLNENAWTIAFKSEGDPSQHAGILQIKDFPYLKKETKMSAYSFDEIKSYEKELGLRELIKETSTSLIYKAKDPNKVNFDYIRYDIYPTDESKSGPIVRTDRFNKAMYKQPELRSYFELNGFTYEGSFETYAEKFVNKELAVRLRVSDKSPGAIILFEDAPDLYSKDPVNPDKPKFQALYLPLLDVFGQKISKDSPIIAREQETHPDCTVEFKPANENTGYKYDAIKVNMPFRYKLDPEDRTKPRAVSYAYESINGSSVVDQISYDFGSEWEKANINGDDPMVKTFMEQNGFTYKGSKTLQNDQGKVKVFQYHNATKEIYFEYIRIIEPSFMTLPMGTYTKTPTVTL